MRKRAFSLVCVAGLVSMLVLVPLPAWGAATYRLQLDARPPTGEPWSFLRLFPGRLSVHQGDTIDAAWGGVGTPHTATAVPNDNASAWRASFQGPGGPQDPSAFPWALQVPDTAVGGDDPQIDINPAVAAPSDPTCGTSGNPCDFDGSSVVNSGFAFSSPGSQPQFFVHVTAPVGSYSFLCLIHPGMQIPLRVVGSGASIPSPSKVTDVAQQEIQHARTHDGSVADSLAQTVKKTPVGTHDRLTIWAGGFWNQVSADEYPDRRLRMHVGDRLRVLGNFEIHTATFPKHSAQTVPFIGTQCEVAGPDTPATSPGDCAAPTDFQIAFNSTALLPTASNLLKTRSAFVSSGLLTYGNDHTFVAKRPGIYTFVCLVHGPQMSESIRVS